MRRGLVVLLVLVAMGSMAAGAYAGGGNSDAAHACQKNGYLNLHRSDGSSFKNTGACVSYFAQGGTARGCSVTATSGCLRFDNVAMSSVFGTGDTVTVNAAFSFISTCNLSDATTTCPAGTLNSFATGGGTYVIKDASGATVEQGTITTADTAGSRYEGLAYAGYTGTDGFTPTTCAAAGERQVDIYGSTNVASDPYVEIGAFTIPADPTNGDTQFATISGMGFEGSTTGVTLTC
jgi:hypothetical protein